MKGGLLLYRVEGDSMLPSLPEGDYLLAHCDNALKRQPVRGDVVIAVLEDCERSILKRVVGLPGEQIAFSEGMLLIDGQKLEEPYLRGLPPYLGLGNSCFTPGPDEYFLLGDNRAHSTDSRHYGPVRRAKIEGKVVCRIWPPLRWGIL